MCGDDCLRANTGCLQCCLRDRRQFHLMNYNKRMCRLLGFHDENERNESKCVSAPAQAPPPSLICGHYCLSILIFLIRRSEVAFPWQQNWRNGSGVRARRLLNAASEPPSVRCLFMETLDVSLMSCFRLSTQETRAGRFRREGGAFGNHRRVD